MLQCLFLLHMRSDPEILCQKMRNSAQYRITMITWIAGKLHQWWGKIEDLVNPSKQLPIHIPVVSSFFRVPNGGPLVCEEEEGQLSSGHSSVNLHQVLRGRAGSNGGGRPSR